MVNQSSDTISVLRGTRSSPSWPSGWTQCGCVHACRCALKQQYVLLFSPSYPRFGKNPCGKFRWMVKPARADPAWICSSEEARGALWLQRLSFRLAWTLAPETLQNGLWIDQSMRPCSWQWYYVWKGRVLPHSYRCWSPGLWLSREEKAEQQALWRTLHATWQGEGGTEPWEAGVRSGTCQDRKCSYQVFCRRNSCWPCACAK